MRPGLSKLMLVLASSIVSLLLSEGLLRTLGIPARTLTEAMDHDAVLLYRMPASFPGIDAEGFRNALVPDRADIVALGDSHTYGNGVEPREAWPQQFAQVTGLTVHNLGMGGYGPLQYLHLAERALRLHPRTLVVALYPANDFEDVCVAARGSQALEAEARSEGLDVEYCRHGPVRRKERKLPEEGEDGLFDGPNLLRIMELGLRKWNARREPDPRLCFLVRDDRNRTLFLRRALSANRDALALEDAENSRSIGTTKQILVRIADLARRGGARPIVLVVPSKQLALRATLGGGEWTYPRSFARPSTTSDGSRPSSRLSWPNA